MALEKKLIIEVAKKLAGRGYVEVVNRGANGKIIEIVKVGTGLLG